MISTGRASRGEGFLPCAGDADCIWLSLRSDLVELACQWGNQATYPLQSQYPVAWALTILLGSFPAADKLAYAAQPRFRVADGLATGRTSAVEAQENDPEPGCSAVSRGCAVFSVGSWKLLGLKRADWRI